MIDPMVWRLVAVHPEYVPPYLRARLLPVVVPPPREKVRTLALRFAERSEPPAEEIWVPDVRRFVVNCAEIQIEPTLAEVARTTSKFYNVTVLDMVGHSRMNHIIRARHVAFYLSRKMTRQTMTNIGRFYDDRDHSTVLMAIAKMEQKWTSDPRLRDEIELLMRKLSEACVRAIAAQA